MKIARLAKLTLATTAVAAGLALAPGTAAFAHPGAAYIGPGPGYANNPTAVRCVQYALDVTLDSEFGQETYDAVRALQAQNNLPADGIVGPETGDLIQRLLPSDSRVYCYSYVPTTYRAVSA